MVLVFVHREKREKVEKNKTSNENEVETSQLESLSNWIVSTSFSFDLGFFLLSEKLAESSDCTL